MAKQTKQVVLTTTIPATGAIVVNRFVNFAGAQAKAGEAVALSPEQYEQVAAHVSAAEINDEALAESGYAPDGETPLQDTPSETPETPAPKRGRAKAAE